MFTFSRVTGRDRKKLSNTKQEDKGIHKKKIIIMRKGADVNSLSDQQN